MANDKDSFLYSKPETVEVVDDTINQEEFSQLKSGKQNNTYVNVSLKSLCFYSINDGNIKTHKYKTNPIYRKNNILYKYDINDENKKPYIEIQKQKKYLTYQTKEVAYLKFNLVVNIITYRRDCGNLSVWR